MILAIVRHGQSTFNLQNRFTGDIDVPLTLQGEHEAFLAARMLQHTGIRFQDAFSSSLLRCVQTMKIMMRVMDPEKKITHYKSKALNERNYGSLQGFSKHEMEEIYTSAKIQEWRRSFSSRPPGGESLEDTYIRVVSYYKDVIEPLLLASHNVLVVAHGNSLRALMMYVENIQVKDIETTEISTGKPLLYDVHECARYCLAYARMETPVLSKGR